MPSLSPCAACAHFVKTGDALCPFCGVAMAARRPRASAPRMSRAAWLALSSSAAALGCAATLTACAGDDTEGGAASAVTPGDAATASAVTPDDAGGTGARPDASDASVGDEDASDAGVIDANATFPCGDAACLVSTEYCADTLPSEGCVEEGTSCVPWSSMTPTCPEQTCACLLGPYTSSCGTVAGGGTYVTLLASCNPCYGSPPARLERLARLHAAV